MRISDWSSDVCSSDLIIGAQRKAVGQPFAIDEMFIAEPAGKTRSGGLRIAAAGIEQQAAAVGKDELGLSGQRLDILARLKADADSGAVKKGLTEESGQGDGAAIIGRAAQRTAVRTEKSATLNIDRNE